MASQSSQDPLDVLQTMVNDVLVHTGKALRASRKDTQGNTQATQATLKSKLPESIDGFREALHKLESDIIDAKSVLMRDIKRLREQKQQSQQSQQIQRQRAPALPQPPQSQSQSQYQPQTKNQPQSQPQSQPQPQPVESQSKSPMVIDLESSPPPPPPQDQPMTEIKANKPVAPFPDMGMGLPEVDQSSDAVNNEASLSTVSNTVPEQQSRMKTSTSPVPPSTVATASMAPMPIMEQKPADNHNNDVMDLTNEAPHSELNFTNMQFTLAPGNNDPQNSSVTQETSFDLATFAPPEGNDNILGLDDLLPNNNTSQTNDMPQMSAGSAESVSRPEPLMSTENQGMPQELSTNNIDSVFDDEIFDGLDTGGGLADGTGDPTFDDLMNDRDDDDFNYLGGDDFEEAFFLQDPM
ncbi:Ff.00g083610.m01.CDS01 [Fusarium sp. VM40]|nr:Ff.00g083610.m01.CDS01 [Fusarium sp. VM40]